MIHPIYATLQLSETDKKAIIILLVFLVIAFLLIGLIGVAIRLVMRWQAKRTDTMLYDAVVTHVVDSPKAFRSLGHRKNNRILYRDSLIPFLIAVIASLTLVIYNIATGAWGDNIWVNCKDLFFEYDWVGTPENPVFVKVFNISMLARWPDVTHTPEFLLEHLCSYIVCFLYVVAAIYYLYVCQAYLSRLWLIQIRSQEVFHKSLKGYKVNEGDPVVKKENPIPPAD